MSTVIKATDHNAAIQSVAFQFDDLSDWAGAYLDKVRREAAAIVLKAQKEAAGIRKQAEVEGRRDYEKIVTEQLGQKLATLMPALERAIQEIQDAKQAWLSQWEKSAMRVATAIAQRVVRREMARSPEITLALVRETLELAAGSAQLQIRLNPSDHEMLAPQVQALLKELVKLGPAEVVADASITPGGCRVDTRFGSIDQQIESQLARIEQELT